MISVNAFTFSLFYDPVLIIGLISELRSPFLSGLPTDFFFLTFSSSSVLLILLDFIATIVIFCERTKREPPHSVILFIFILRILSYVRTHSLVRCSQKTLMHSIFLRWG